MDCSIPGLPVLHHLWSLLKLIDLDYCDTEWFALETNSDLSVIFDIASKYCISHCGGKGQQWPAAEAGVLGAADLGVA